MTDRDRLIELLLKCDKENDVLSCFHERQRKKQSAEIIADYLIANGVIVPPCKVGDKLYEITSRKTISEYQVTAIHIELFGIFVDWKITQGFVDRYISDMPVGEIGKTVFLTREEAENALKE